MLWATRDEARQVMLTHHRWDYKTNQYVNVQYTDEANDDHLIFIWDKKPRFAKSSGRWCRPNGVRSYIYHACVDGFTKATRIRIKPGEIREIKVMPV